MHAGSREVNLPGAAAVPHMHVGIGCDTPLGDTFPGAQALQDALAGGRQGTDPGLERRVAIERFDR
ncbi:hypothetical protein D3C76_1746420 [compost metagenome]